MKYIGNLALAILILWTLSIVVRMIINIHMIDVAEMFTYFFGSAFLAAISDVLLNPLTSNKE